MREGAKIDLIEPARCFETPHEVVVNDELTPKQKEKALSNWEEERAVFPSLKKRA